MVRLEIKVIITFKNENENIAMSPVALSREMRKKVDEVEMAKVL